MTAPILAGVVECYEAGLRAARERRTHGWRVRTHSGDVRELPLHRWCGDVGTGDQSIIDRCCGPTIDVGCGPGRIVAGLTRQGIPALGIDLAAEAVRQTRARGGAALRRDVFSRVPGEGRWNHVVLADGNIGIGGDPLRLLHRARKLLTPGGTIICETDPPGTPVKRLSVRLEHDQVHSSWFDWAHIGMHALIELAPQAELQVRTMWTQEQRWFAVLHK